MVVDFQFLCHLLVMILWLVNARRNQIAATLGRKSRDLVDNPLGIIVIFTDEYRSHDSIFVTLLHLPIFLVKPNMSGSGFFSQA
jgi:hypothetical protein